MFSSCLQLNVINCVQLSACDLVTCVLKCMLLKNSECVIRPEMTPHGRLDVKSQELSNELVLP